MKRQHFETLQPICPLCRVSQRGDSPLRIARVVREEQLDILEGVLQCDHAMCLREYPILDGIPLLVSNIREYVEQNALAILCRNDLSSVMQSIVGDCLGPASAYDVNRQHLSSYVWDHYGDLDPEEGNGAAELAYPQAEHTGPGGVVRALQDVWQSAAPIASGPILDIGCSVGRSAVELAETTGELVLGVDLNHSMLRWASQLVRQSRVRYACRDVGLVYRHREYPVHFRNLALVDFWACDAMNLPFRRAVYPAAVALNVLDCVPAPLTFLAELSHVLQPQGRAMLTTPFDWSPAATPVEAWIGGHSGRGPDGGQSETVLRRWLTGDAGTGIGLELVDAGEAPPWHVRLHARSTMMYRNHRIVLQSSDAAEPGIVRTTPTQITQQLPAQPTARANLA